jgi:hypothetical protein
MRSLSFFVRMRRTVLLLQLALVCAMTGAVQAQSRPLITAQIDESSLVQLKGTVSPRLKGAKDLGAVDSAEPSGRLLLVLKRSPEQEADLQTFLQQTHQPGSPNFHHWLTPAAFGERFGVAHSDLEKLTEWLQGHGLSVANTSAGKDMIEFSGTVGQVQDAFHTSIHSYSVNGAIHHANATNPEIPAALQSVVATVSQLNDFRPRSYAALLGQAAFNPANHQGKPTSNWTYPVGAEVSDEPFYFLAPEDVATQYDIAPAYAAGITGAGQTIGIINDADIDISLVNAYRKLFHLPVNPPQVVVDGNDPGINGDSTEAYLDVENAGAVAPDATVKLYTAENVGFLGDGGLSFAILRAVNDDAASVLSLSFGSCEVDGGSGFNTYINSVWEEAAAQGQTVLVSTGDTGPEDGCQGLGVSPYASSPWAVAVGGTDIYLTDYATGGASLSTLWADTNDASLGSLQKPFAEQPWDGSQFGLNDITYDSVADQPYNRGAGGGGASACIQSTTDPDTGIVTCLSGWPKPSFQVGTGVPADGVRDIPDVSLFASNGYNGVTWPICAFPGDCTENDLSTNALLVTGVGGTSASAPAMAGIMALINQKYGPQGQADYVLYPLAAQFPAVFNPVTVGSNNITCATSSFGCSADASDDFDSYQLYPAAPGYDLASGLGTVDVNQMLTDWPKIAFAASKTSIFITPTTITHGDNVTVTATVTGKGDPTGAVSILSSTPLPSNKSVTYIELGAGGTGTAFVPNLPGGTYSVTGQYSGDGINAPGTSAPVTVTVNPEASTLVFTPEFLSPATYEAEPIKPGEPIPYNTGILLDIQIEGAAGQFDGVPTGSVTFTDGGNVVGVAQVSSGGTAEFEADSLPPGTHSIVASYSGDASYNASAIAPFNLVITKASLTGYVVADLNATYNDDGSVVYPAGASAAVTAYFQTLLAAEGACPSGAVSTQFDNEAPVVLNITPCLSVFAGFGSSATELLTNLKVGTHTLTFSYPGDTDYGPLSLSQVIEVTPSTLLPSTATVTLSPSDITSSTEVTATVTVAGNGTVTPTGTVLLSLQNYEYFPADKPVTLTPAGNGTATGSFTFLSSEYTNGPSEFLAVYSGDGTYLPSATPVQIFGEDTTAFFMSAVTPNVAIQSGGSGTADVTLTSENGFAGTVALTCTAPASLVCTLPSSPTALAAGGSTTATITINTAVPATSSKLQQNSSPFKGFVAPVLAGMLFFLLPNRRRYGRVLVALLFCAVLGTAIGCGGGSEPAPPAPTPTPTPTPAPTPVLTNAAPGTYNVVVTGTLPNGVTHNAAITVIVQ